MKLVEELCYDLRKSGFCACCITVKIRYSNFDTFTKQLNIQMSASDLVMIKHVIELFNRLYERRILGVHLSLRLTSRQRGCKSLIGPKVR